MPLTDCRPASISQIHGIRHELLKVRLSDRPLNIVVTQALVILNDIMEADLTDPDCTTSGTRFLHGRLSATLDTLRAMGSLPTALHQFSKDPYVEKPLQKVVRLIHRDLGAEGA